jgi:ABC-2 type transport system permease protein
MTVAAQAGGRSEGPLAPPGGPSGLAGVFQRRYLLRLLLRKELQVRYQGSMVGLAWSYVKPLVRFFMYFFVMGILLGLNRFEDFALHIFSGMVVLHLFTETLNAGTRSIVRNRSLITKIALPRETFPVASLMVSGYHVVPQMVVLVIMAVVYGYHFDPIGLAAGVLGFAVMAVYALSAALFFGALNVFYRDIQNLVDTISILITWSVPMIYPLNRIYNAVDKGGMPDWGVEAYLANPLANAVLLFERCWWIPASEDPVRANATEMPSHLFERGFICLAVGLVVLYFAQRMFSRLEGRFAERL